MTLGAEAEGWRHMVAKMARARTRIVGLPPKFPSRWQPRTVLSATTNLPLSDAEAFELLAQKIESGWPVRQIPLRQPPGDRAYVLKFMIGTQAIYAKFQVKSVFVGRSFHIDEPGGDQE